jgi:hypothetical protein
MATADISFTELAVDGRVGGGHGWMEVSDNGVVAFAKYTDPNQTYGLGPMQGLTWSKADGVKLIADNFATYYGAGPQYLSIDNDGDTVSYGNQVYRNGELVLTTNTGSDKYLTTLSPNGDIVGIKSYYDGPSSQNIDDQSVTPVGAGLPNDNYRVADYSNDSSSILLSSNVTNFPSPEPFFIRNADGSMYEIPHPFGSIADLSGDGSTVIGRSFHCEETYSCTLISTPAATFEIGDGTYFPEGVNRDGTLAVLSYRDYDNNDWAPYIWDSINGLRSLVDLLGLQGIDISGWEQVRLFDISDNGHFIVGAGRDPEGNNKVFLIDATPQCSPNGLI